MNCGCKAMIMGILAIIVISKYFIIILINYILGISVAVIHITWEA